MKKYELKKYEYFYLFSGRIYNRFSYFLLIMVIFFRWDANAFGMYTSRVGTWAILQPLISVGISKCALRVISNDTSDEKHLLLPILKMLVIFCAFSIVLVIAFSFAVSCAFNRSVDWLDISVGTYSVLSAGLIALQSIGRAVGKNRYDVFLAVGCGTATIAACVFIWLMPVLPLFLAIYLIIIYTAFDLLAGKALVRSYLKKGPLPEHNPPVTGLYKFAIILGLNSLVGGLSLSVINVFFRLHSMMGEAGKFNLMIMVSSVALAFYEYFLLLQFPRFAQANNGFNKNGQDLLQIKLRKLFLFVPLFLIAGILVIMTLHAGTIKLLIIMACLLPVLMLVELILTWSEAVLRDRLHRILFGCVCGTLLCSLISYFFLPVLRAEGIAVIWSATECLAAYYALSVCGKQQSGPIAKGMASGISAAQLEANRSMEKRHWAFDVAQELKRKIKTRAEKIRVQSSISPSGIIHIGNFRDTVTAWAVCRALQSQNLPVEFILNFDDADCAKNTKEKKPLSEVPHQGESMAAYFSGRYLNDLDTIGIHPDRVLFQSREYFEKRRYDRLIYRSIRKRKKIRSILNLFRPKKLAASWNPLILYCDCCKTLIEQFRTVYSFPIGTRCTVSYVCSHCGHSFTGYISNARYKKLMWRVDWPMRCLAEDIDFEPCGIDHFVAGSTICTASKICKKIYHRTMPTVCPYEIVKLRNMNKKLSSSRGDTLDLHILLKMFSKQQIIWMYLSRRPMNPIVFDFSEGFFRYHAEFDQFLAGGNSDLDRSGLDLRDLTGCADTGYIGCVSIRTLCFVYQAFAGNERPLITYFHKNKPDRPLEDIENEIKIKIPFVSYWLENFAPERCRFKLTCPAVVTSQHCGLASAVLQWLDQPSRPVSFKQPSLFYEMMFSKTYGPRIQTVLTYYGRQAIREHCKDVLLKYNELQKRG